MTGMAGLGPGASPHGAPRLGGNHCHPELDYTTLPVHTTPPLQEIVAKPYPAKPNRRSGPVGRLYRIRNPRGHGYLYPCACGTICDGRACTTCDRKGVLASVLYWCSLCRRQIDSRSRFCGRCGRLHVYDRAKKSRTRRGIIRDVRSYNNRTGALVRISPRSSAEIHLPEPALLPVQPFRSPYRPAHACGGKTRCGCGSITTGRACSTHGRRERAAGIIHFCRLCRTDIPGSRRRCGRCRGQSSFDANRRRHHLDGHVYDHGSWRNRTGAFAMSGSGRTYPADHDDGAAERGREERRPAEAGLQAEPERSAHRCADPEWSRVHGMGRIRFLGRNSTYCGRCKKGFEYLYALAKICPCCGDEVWVGRAHQPQIDNV